MNREKFWAMLGDNLIEIVTVLGGTIVIIIQIVRPNLFTTDDLLGAILTLLVLLATSEIIERTRTLSRIENKLERIQIEGNIQHIGVLNDYKEIYSYWDKKSQELIKSMDSVRFNPPYKPHHPDKHSYRSNLPKVAKNKGIIRRYIVVIHDLETLDRIEKDFNEYPEGKYFVGYFPKESVELPMMTFAIADGEEITFGAYHRPFETSGTHSNILTRNPEVVRIFQSYFDVLWTKCEKLNNQNGIRYDLLSSIRNNLEEGL